MFELALSFSSSVDQTSFMFIGRIEKNQHSSLSLSCLVEKKTQKHTRSHTSTRSQSLH